MTGALALLFLAGILYGVVSLFRSLERGRKARYARLLGTEEEPTVPLALDEVSQKRDLRRQKELRRREAEREEGEIDVPPEWRIDGE